MNVASCFIWKTWPDLSRVKVIYGWPNISCVFTPNSYLLSFLPLGSLVYLSHSFCQLLSTSLFHRTGINERGGCTRAVTKSVLWSVVIRSQSSAAIGIPREHRLFLYDFFSNGATAPSGPGPPHYRGFTITLRHTALGRTPLDEWSARRRDLYLTTHNTYKRDIDDPPARFEPTIPASEQNQTHALDRAAAGTSRFYAEYRTHKKYLLKYRWNFHNVAASRKKTI
jgi:hypothetical protein